MTKISIYSKDVDVRGNDRWIGSDAQNQNRTKNFTPDNVAVYFNENQVIDLGVELRYFYDTLDPLQQRVYGSITFETEIGPQVNFSAISTFILSKYTMGHTDVSQFLDFLIGSNVLLSRSNNINMFGYYKIDNIEPYLPDPNFFVVTLTFETGNGYMKEDEDYFISLVQFEQTIPEVPTKTSDLINDGEDGVHPFITAEDVPTPTLQSVTDEGDTTTTTVYLNGGAISESINEQAVFAPAQLSTVNLNSGSGATLDSTGKLALSPDGIVSALFASDNITQSITLQVPNKAPGSYTLATTDDIPAAQLVALPFTTDHLTATNNPYVIGDIVWYLGNVYRCIANNDSIVPTSTLYWTNLGAGNPLVEQPMDWNSTSGNNQILNKPTIPDVTGFVPYTGATQNVNLGEYELKAGQLSLDVSPTGTAAVGTTRWNDSIGSSETTLKGGSVILKNGVDLVARVVNKVTPNTTLTKAAYQAVRVSGAQGQRLAVAYAQANNDNNSADTIGLVCETIATNQEGFIMTVGQLEEINTTGSLQGETWADGDVLYLSPTTAGRLTNIKPTGVTGHIVVMGYVEYAHAIHGKIYVKIMNGWELDELHNVYITSPANNQGLFYDSSDQLWKNETIASALGYTPFQLPALTSGSVLFSNGSTIAQDNANLFYSETDKRFTLRSNNQALRGFAQEEYSNAVGAASMTFQKSRGTFASPINVNANDLVGAFTFSARIGGAFTSDRALFGANMASTTGMGMYFITGSVDGVYVPSLYIHPSKNVAIGSTQSILTGITDAGFKLDVNGTARFVSDIRSTTGIFIGTTSTFAGVFPTGTAGRESLLVRSNLLSTDAGTDIAFNNAQGDVANLSGTRNLTDFSRGFNPTSGSGVYNLINIRPTINQGAGAVGITRGIFISPTLTSVTDFRAIENSVGKVCLNTTSGNTMIGTTTDAGFKLDVNGTARVSGNATFGTLGTGTGMFWDNTNNRLGIGTNSPQNKVDINLGVGNITNGVAIRQSSSIGYGSVTLYDNRNSTSFVGQFGLYGSGVAAPNTSNMFFYNSAGGGTAFYVGSGANPTTDLRMLIAITGNVLIGTVTDIASSKLTVESTTQGFLPPRMTTTQKNAIATPAAGLVVYDTTLGKLCVRTAAAWETITSI